MTSHRVNFAELAQAVVLLDDNMAAEDTYRLEFDHRFSTHQTTKRKEN
jgi:hypothetical protein